MRKQQTKFPEGILINVTAAGVINYPEGCNGFYSALSAFQDRRAEEQQERLDTERKENYRMAQGTMQRPYDDTFLNTCVRVFKKDANGKDILIRTDKFNPMNDKDSLKGTIPTVEQLRYFWERSRKTVNEVAEAFGVGWKTAQLWLLQAGITPSKKHRRGGDIRIGN